MFTQGKWTPILAEHKKWFHGIRNRGGFLCFLRPPQRYADQQERYETEIQTNKDDARLIAAAPELLEACKMASQSLRTYEPGTAEKQQQEARLMLVKAIAKAQSL